MSEKLPSYEDFIVDESSLPSVDELVVKNNLPSVDVIVDESNFPSVEELIEENNLPSVDDYIDMSVGAGNTAIIDTAPCSIEEEIKEDEQQPDLTEIIDLINDVRKDIPEIPEIKYYDSELESILEQIKEIPEVRYYDNEIEAVCDQIDHVKEEIKQLPEPKYYDEEINQVKQTISNLPKVKYYDEEISNLEEDFSKLKKFVSDAPNYDDELNSLRDKFNYEIQQFSENVEVKDFDKKIEIDNLKISLKETTEKIYEELKKSSDQIHEYRLHLKDDDRKLKKQILGHYNLLKENIEKQVNEFNTKNIESQNIITGSLKNYFDNLQEKISTLPEVKYYDEQIEELDSKFNIDIKELYEIVNELKKTQKQTLEENLLTEPPSTDDEDQSTPLNQNFVTYEKLQENYQLFVNKVQQQLASFGGGGEVRLEFLDDIDRDTALVDGKFLKYQASTKTFVGADASGGGGGGSQTLDEVLSEGNSSSTGISVGVVTATSFSGDGSDLTGLTASQIPNLAADKITSGTIDADRIPTLNQNTSGTSAGLTGSPSVELTNIVGAAASVTGIVTATTFVGALTGNVTGNVSGTSGSTTGNAATATKLATARTIAGVSFDGSANISLNNNAITNGAGYITTSFTNTNQLTNGAGFITASDDITGNAATATKLETARNIGGVSFDGSAAINLPGVNESGNQNTSGTAAGLSGTPNITVGDIVASSLDISGDADIDGTLEADAITVNGTALDTHIAGVTVSNATNASGLTGTPNISVGSVSATTGAFSSDVTLTNTDTDSSAGPIINLFRNSSSPADADYLGQIKFQGESDTGVQRNYAKITGKISDASNGTEDGIIEFAHIKAGSQNISARFKSTELQLLNDTDFSVAGDSTFTGAISGSSASFTGNVSVGGTLTYEDVTNVDSIGIVTARSGIELGAGSITPIISIEAATSTTTTTSASNIDTFTAATFRSAQYQIQITQGSNYHVTTLNVLHDGSSVYLSEFGTIRTGASLASFDADIDSGNVRVRATPTTDSSTVFKLTKTLTRV